MAQGKYAAAVQADPKLAEAHFRLGVLSAEAGDAQAAIKHYEDAGQAEPGVEKYHGNLAEQYLLQGEYDRAIAIDESLDEYPLASLEAAKGHWAKGEVRRALARQELALRWLDNPEVMALPKNRVRWRLETLSVATNQDLACKRYYAALSQAASQFLLAGGEGWPAAAGCAKGEAVRRAVVADLRRYAAKLPGWEAFVGRLLGQ